MQVLEETSSSNDELLRLGEVGAPAGSLIFTERQTAGRGQFQRPWASAPGLGLWFSLLLRLEINDGSIPSLSAFAAVAIVQTAGALGIADCGIKAPNDVLIAGRKAAGILIETRMGKSHPPTRTSFAVVGIGLNVNHAHPDSHPSCRTGPPRSPWPRAPSAIGTGWPRFFSLTSEKTSDCCGRTRKRCSPGGTNS